MGLSNLYWQWSFIVLGDFLSGYFVFRLLSYFAIGPDSLIKVSLRLSWSLPPCSVLSMVLFGWWHFFELRVRTSL